MRITGAFILRTVLLTLLMVVTYIRLFELLKVPRPLKHDAVTNLVFATSQNEKEALEFLNEHPLVIGVPTVYRPTSYLVKTIQSLVQVPLYQLANITIIVYNFNSPDAVETVNMTQILGQNYKGFLDNGTLVLETLHSQHEELLRPLPDDKIYNDSSTRHFWRSKQALDTSKLFHHISQLKASYYLHLEDDILASKDYVTDIALRLRDEFHLSSDWFMVTFFNGREHKHNSLRNPSGFGGALGFVTRVSDLRHLAKVLKQRFLKKPVDWLIGDYVLEEKKHIVVKRPNLFAHIGGVSTLKEKSQLVTFADFKDQDVVERYKKETGQLVQ